MTNDAYGDSPEAAFDNFASVHPFLVPKGKYFIARNEVKGGPHHKQAAVIERRPVTQPQFENHVVEL